MEWKGHRLISGFHGKAFYTKLAERLFSPFSVSICFLLFPVYRVFLLWKNTYISQICMAYLPITILDYSNFRIYATEVIIVLTHPHFSSSFHFINNAIFTHLFLPLMVTSITGDLTSPIIITLQVFSSLTSHFRCLTEMFIDFDEWIFLRKQNKPWLIWSLQGHFIILFLSWLYDIEMDF
jgi:hypothetical protein